MSMATQLFNSALDLENAYEFEKARTVYAKIASDHPNMAESARAKMDDMDLLIEEKKIYERIDRNAREVLTRIGVNIAESEQIMEILMEADAIDFDNTEAVYVPLKRDYMERCLEMVPRTFRGDPGKNSFGTGATPPFLKRPGDDELRPANSREFMEIVEAARENADVVDIFSVPVQTDKHTSDFECAQMMHAGFSGLKMISTKKMSDQEVAFFSGKDDWVDGTTLLASLTPMNTMVEPFLRSVRAGNNLLILDLSIAGFSAPHSPESLLTLIHAQELFMMVLAQTITPGITCMHGGIPGVTESGGDLSYTSFSQSLTNAAMARVNLWITGIPSAQSGGSTSVTDDMKAAIEESEYNRNALRKYGVHVVRHALGALGSLTYFSLEKFREDCKREADARRAFAEAGDAGIAPLYFPADDKAFEGIREMAEMGGNPRSTNHALRNVKSFMDWEETVNLEEAEKYKKKAA
jgi:trimethylamine--corrinoid protein Co-methyltransferase